MKRVLIAATIFFAVFASQPAGAQSILHFLDSYTALETSAVRGALAQLGLPATETTHGTFSTDLASQSWDLVIVDVPGSGIAGADTTDLSNYIAGGGRSILSYWLLNADPSLASAFEVTVNASYDGEFDVYQWDTGHAVFNVPNSVANLTDFTDRAGDNGDRLSLSGGTAIGGFTPAPAVGEAAIVVGNGGRTIANGFLFWDMKDIADNIAQNNIDLVANEIAYVLTIPEPAACVLAVIGFLGLFGCVRRRLS